MSLSVLGDSVDGTECFPVRFRVRVSLSAAKSTVHLSNKAEGSSVHSYNFYCASFMGGG